jgi:GNAT superfamily N-acetyltransferase
MTITIRRATRADIATLARFNLGLAWETEHKRLDLDILTRGITAVFDNDRRGFYLVAERDGEIVGGLLITYEWSDWRCGDWWWIQSVFVSEDARRSGVFRALYAAIEAQSRATPGAIGLRLYVEWENERAQRTYESLGMEKEHYHLYAKPYMAFPIG